MQPLKSIKCGDKTVHIYQDCDGESPRNWDNLGVMVCFHRRYDLPCEADYNQQQFESWEHMEATIHREEDAVVILPIYMYDHSGVAFSIEPFSCPWDSGRVGLIFARRSDVVKEYGKFDSSVAQIVTTVLRQEVHTYSQYAMGDVYAYVVERFNDVSMSDEVLDSCYGFYGVENAEAAGLEAAKAQIGPPPEQSRVNSQAR